MVIVVQGNPSLTWNGQEIQTLTRDFDAVGEIKYPSTVTATKSDTKLDSSETPENVLIPKFESLVHMNNPTTVAVPTAADVKLHTVNHENVQIRNLERVIEIVQIPRQIVRDHEQLCAYFKSETDGSNYSKSNT